MKKKLLIVSLAVFALFLTSCIAPVNEVLSLEIFNFTAEERYQVGDSASLESVKLLVTLEDGNTLLLDIDDEDISFVGNGINSTNDGLDTGSTGEKSVRISYMGVSYTVHFHVVKHLVRPGESIQTKITNADINDTIYIAPGFHHVGTAVDVNKTVNIVGPNHGTASITKTKTAGSNNLFNISANGVQIEKLTLNLGPGDAIITESSLLSISGNSVIIMDNTIHGSFGTFTSSAWDLNGIQIEAGSTGTVIEDNIVYNFGTGLLIEDTVSFSSIMDNTFESNRVHANILIDPIGDIANLMLVNNSFTDDYAEVYNGSTIRDIGTMKVATALGLNLFNIDSQSPFGIDFLAAQQAHDSDLFWLERNGAVSDLVLATSGTYNADYMNTEIGGDNNYKVAPYYGNDAKTLRAGTKTLAMTDIAYGMRLDEIIMEYTFTGNPNGTLSGVPYANYFITDGYGHFGIFSPSSLGLGAVSTTIDNGDGTHTRTLDFTNPNIPGNTKCAIYEHNGLVDYWGEDTGLSYTSIDWDIIKHYTIAGIYDYQRSPMGGWEVWGEHFSNTIIADSGLITNFYGIALIKGDTVSGADYQHANTVTNLTISFLGREFPMRFDNAQLDPTS
jgi:hypothetical protein